MVSSSPARCRMPTASVESSAQPAAHPHLLTQCSSPLPTCCLLAGFISPDDKAQPDVFVHQTVIQSNGFRFIKENERVRTPLALSCLFL